ncbi:MAG: substrate binding domain-containing protein, partial [Janthinobacterium lividum]
DFGRRRIAPALARFAQAHPELVIQLVLSDAGAQIGEDLLDVAIRTGLPADQNVVARKLATAPMLLCAAPAYVEAHGAPATLADLQRHRCLLLARRHRRIDRWHYRDAAGSMADIAVGGTLSSTSGDVLRQWALAGEGLSLEAAWDVAEDIRDGRLVECLPGIAWQELNLYATFLPGRPVPARIRLFVDWLATLVLEQSVIAVRSPEQR